MLLSTDTQPARDFLPERGDRDPDPLSIGLLQFSHLSGLLDSEMDLIAVLADNLQLDVLGVFSHVDGQEAGSISPLKMATYSEMVVTPHTNWTLER